MDRSQSTIPEQIKLPYFGVVIRRPPHYNPVTESDHAHYGQDDDIHEPRNVQDLGPIGSTGLSAFGMGDESFWETLQFDEFPGNLSPWLDNALWSNENSL